jgi:hypothetical protein
MAFALKQPHPDGGEWIQEFDSREEAVSFQADNGGVLVMQAPLPGEPGLWWVEVIDGEVVDAREIVDHDYQLMGMHPEVHLRYRDRAWECTQAAPEVWFGGPMLELRSFDGNPWSRDGDFVKLSATNGSWIWRLTGETIGGENIDGPLEMHRAVWPD